MNKVSLKLGTRRSWLAIAQSSWVARELERLNPGLSIELVGIETRGDVIQDVPLSQVEGKEFFVAELDEALASSRVDLCVHSMKDLSLERPAAFVSACVPARENPRDIVVFHSARAEARLRSGQVLRLGTSAPRRMELVPSFLEKALPHFSGSAPTQVACVEIRGNVNTRLSRLHESDSSPRQLDGVVLAAAGLNRLMADTEVGPAMYKLFQGTRMMVLPVDEVPGSPAQGALAVECRANDVRARAICAPLNCVATAAATALERAVLKEWGGGCHQALGATVQFLVGQEYQSLLFVRGQRPGEPLTKELRWAKPAAVRGSKNHAFLSSEGFVSTARTSLSNQTIARLTAEPLWVLAHSRALRPELEVLAHSKRLWVAGTASWFKLAQAGFWVEGSAEGLGAARLKEQLNGALFPRGHQAVYLTHSDAPPEPSYETLVSYGLTRDSEAPSSEVVTKLANSLFFYWKAASQYDALAPFLSRDTAIELHHACGSGRTFELLKAKGLSPQVFPNVEEWTSWLIP